VEHLIQAHGKRRILFLRGPLHQEDSIRREAGYKSALAANGIPFDEKLVLNGEYERDIAFQALNDFLCNGQHVAFDAVFSGDDDAAIGVLRALHKYEYRIPEDVVLSDLMILDCFFSKPPDNGSSSHRISRKNRHRKIICHSRKLGLK
jgi:DNA-binding LacI/PurR family transcriptional regulator